MITTLTLFEGEPLAGAIARAESTPWEGVASRMRRSRGDNDTTPIAFALPRGIDHILRIAGVQSGVNETIERNTAYPAVAPFLEEDERHELISNMRSGEETPYRIPVCTRSGAVGEMLRFCPTCAVEQRNGGVFMARWATVHHLFGVDVCARHGCRLIRTSIFLSRQLLCPNAEDVVPTTGPEATAGGEEDVVLSRDLAELFVPDSPRPGRRRIASALQDAVLAAGYVYGGASCAVSRLFADLKDNWGASRLEELGMTFTNSNNSWPRKWFRGVPNIVPAIYIAMIARHVGASLPELLHRADHLPDDRHRRGPTQSDRRVHHSADDIEKHRQRITEVLARSPGMSRTKARRTVDKSIVVMAKADPAWLNSVLPPKLVFRRQPNRARWTATDEELSAAITLRAGEIRAEFGRPRRITEALLHQEIRRMYGFRIRNKKRLPITCAAMRAAVDSVASFADRRISWLVAEVQAGRRHVVPTLSAIIQAAGLFYYSSDDGVQLLAVKALERISPTSPRVA